MLNATPPRADGQEEGTFALRFSIGGEGDHEQLQQPSAANHALGGNVQPDGVGCRATSGHRVTVHYTGWLTNGRKFDSSVDRSQPFSFQLGAGQVICPFG